LLYIPVQLTMLITLGGVSFRVYEDGVVHRKHITTGRWSVVRNTKNTKCGYNIIQIHKKFQITRARMVMFAFDPQFAADDCGYLHHIDLDRLNCSFSNLKRIYPKTRSVWIRKLGHADGTPKGTRL